MNLVALLAVAIVGLGIGFWSGMDFGSRTAGTPRPPKPLKAWVRYEMPMKQKLVVGVHPAKGVNDIDDMVAIATIDLTVPDAGAKIIAARMLADEQLIHLNAPPG